MRITPSSSPGQIGNGLGSVVVNADGSILGTVPAGKAFALPVADSGGQVHNIKAHGAKCDGTTDDTAAILSAGGAAGRGAVFFPPGTTATSGISMSGLSCTFRGAGNASIIQALPGIAGPVIDMTGYSWYPNFLAPQAFGDFLVLGDGTGDTSGGGKTKIGIKAVGANLAFRNVAILNTGGVPLWLEGVEVSRFDSVTLGQPVSANANGVPYWYGRGQANGNIFSGVGMRSVSSNPESASGAVVFEDDGTTAPTQNVFLGCWFEFPHVPTGGTLVVIRGNQNFLLDWQFFDETKISAATGTSYFLLAIPGGTGNAGGNIVRGLIPGSGGGATNIDAGVTIAQSNNVVEGVRGFGTQQILLASGAANTRVSLLGGSPDTAAHSFTDNSGQTNNHLETLTTGGLRVVYKGDLAIPRLFLGADTTAPYVIGAAGVLDVRGTAFQVQDTAVANTPITVHTATGNVAVTMNQVDSGSLPTLIVNGHLRLGIPSGGAAPTIAALNGSTAVSVTGSDGIETITLTTAAGIAADAAVCAMTFNKQYSAVPTVTVTGGNGASAGAVPFRTSVTTSGFTLALHSPPAGATAMTFDCHIIG